MRDRNSPLNFPLFVNQHGGDLLDRATFVNAWETPALQAASDDSPFCARPVGPESRRLRLTIAARM